MSHFFRLKLGTGNGRLNKPATAVLGLLLLCPPAVLADDAGVQTQAPAGVQERDGGLAEVPVQGGLSEVPVQMEERDGGLADVPVPVAMEAQVESDEQVDVNLRLHSSPYPYVGAVAARGGYDDTSGNHFGVKVGYMSAVASA